VEGSVVGGVGDGLEGGGLEDRVDVGDWMGTVRLTERGEQIE
jgi:hypothetical protein